LPIWYIQTLLIRYKQSLVGVVIVWLTITICEKVQLENKRLIPAKYMYNETLNKINVIDNMYHNITRESSETMFISF